MVYACLRNVLFVLCSQRFRKCSHGLLFPLSQTVRELFPRNTWMDITVYEQLRDLYVERDHHPFDLITCNLMERKQRICCMVLFVI